MQVSIDGGHKFVAIESVYLRWDVPIDKEYAIEDVGRHTVETEVLILQLKATENGILVYLRNSDGYVESHEVDYSKDEMANYIYRLGRDDE